MDSPKFSSPERSKSVKTYSGLAKRKRNSVNYTPDQSQSDMSDSETKERSCNAVASGSSKKAPVAAKTPSSKIGPKKVDIHLPGPSPQKRVRKESSASQATGKTPSGKITQPAHRRISSVHSIGRMSPPPSSPKMFSSSSKQPTPSTKPLSAIGSIAKKSPNRFATSEDDCSSVAESTMGTRVRRTEAERIQLFKDDPACREFELHRAQCKRCDKWVNLGRKQTYTVRPWETHRERCDRKIQAGNQSPAVLGDDDLDDAASIAPSVAASEPAVRRTETERRALLEADSRAEQVLPNEVLCKKCQKWIKLSAKQHYALGNWNTHQQRCSGSVPSHRVASAECKLKLVNDAQAKTFTARSVECSNCGVSVALDGDYNLNNWDTHKANCSKTPSVPRIDLSKLAHVSTPVGVPQTTSKTRLSPSATSDDTLIASDTSPPAQRRQKRAREDEHEVERPTNRPRTENYVVPQVEAPGPWGWFLLPFTALISGFREGMKSSG